MAELNGLLQVLGKIDQFVFYKLNGRIVVRRRTSVDRNRIKTDPAFKNTRRANAEFGVASRYAKLVRSKLKQMPKTNLPTQFHSDLTAAVYKAIRLGSGRFGERCFNLSDLSDELQQLTLDNRSNLVQLKHLIVNRNQEMLTLSEMKLISNLRSINAQVECKWYLLPMPKMVFTDQYKLFASQNPILSISIPLLSYASIHLEEPIEITVHPFENYWMILEWSYGNFSPVFIPGPIV